MSRKIPDNNKYFIFGSLPTIENLIQTLGDKITKEITYKQWFVMLIIRDMPEGSSVSEIAKHHGSSRQNVMRILNSLKNHDYVVVDPDPNDRRGYVVGLTEKGRNAMAEISIVGGRFVEDIFAGVSSEDIDATKRVFAQLLNNLHNVGENDYER